MSTSPARARKLFSGLSAISAKEIMSSLVAGLVVGILVVFVIVSLAAMVFAGELEDSLAQGIGLFLFGSLIAGLFMTLTSAIVPVIVIGQDAPAAILAVIASGVVAHLHEHDPGHMLGTVVAAMMLASIMTGVAFWLMGRFNLGKLVRFIPYPVVGGFLGGTGWLLMVGALSVMTDTPLGLGLFEPQVILRWLPGLIFAIALFFILRRFTHFLVLPSMVFGCILLFYLIYYLTTGNLSPENLAEWQLGPFPSGSMFTFMSLRVFSEGHLSAVVDNVLDFSSIIIVSSIALLLNASGLEISYREDIDMNRELKLAGIANILAGLGGGPPTYNSLSLSALGRTLGAHSRLVGIFAFSIVTITLAFGASALAFFPRMIAGGLLFFLGMSFLFEWVYDAWFKLPKLDYFLIWFILIVIATVGFLEGVAAGIVVAVLLFVLSYSRVNVIRHNVTAANFPSYVMRPRLYDQLLRQRGDSFFILELQGFVFFGTADSLVNQIRDRIEDPDQPQLQFLLLDFRLVTGIDSSTALSFSKLNQLAKTKDISVVFTNVSTEFQEILGDDLLKDLKLFPDLDHGVAWCEDRMIEVFTEVGLVAKPKSIIQLIEDSMADEAKDKDWLGMIMPGTKKEPTKRASRLLEFLEKIEAEEEQYLIHENYDIEGLYFVEQGQIRVFKSCEDDSTITLRLLESGTVFGEVDFYAEQKATACYVANVPSTLYFLSLENIKRMEDEDPQLALALHRIIAGTLGKKLTLASDTVQALRN